MAPVVITGSRIPRTNLTAVSPVTIVRGEEFRLIGATNAEDLLNQLPQVNPSQGDFVSAGATGAATVDLRGLGAVRTLVLVNGHRLLPGDPRFPVPDINSIPTPIIQRVEVLTGGAAAVYGSDAVAGVVNFILDTKLNGLKVEGQVSGFQHDNRNALAQGLLDAKNVPYPDGSVLDGRRINLSAAFGQGFFDNRAHVTLYGGYREITGLTEDHRDTSSCPILAIYAGDQATSRLQCGGSVTAYPGNFFDNLGNVYQVTPERTFVPGLGRFNFNPFNYFQRPDKRYTAGAFLNVDLSNAIRPYAEVMFMHDRSVAQFGPSGDATNTQDVNCDNPLLSEQQRTLLCRTGNFIGETPVFDNEGNLVLVKGKPTVFIDPVTSKTYNRAWLLIARRNVEGGLIQDDQRHRGIRALAGFNGDLGRGVTYDASYLFGRADLDWQSRHNVSISGLEKALDVVEDATGQSVCRSALIAKELGPSAPGADPDCVPWDVFAIGQVTPDASAYITLSPFMRGSFKEQVANLNSTIELGSWGLQSPWSKEPPAINLGTEYRKDEVDFVPDESTQHGDLAGFGGQVFPIHGSVETKEVFAEGRVPLVTDRVVKRLAFEGGFRRSWYSNPSNDFTSDTYKLALDLTALPGVRLRTSQQRAIRAPNAIELLSPIQPDSFAKDPCAGNTPRASAADCARSGVTSDQYGHILEVGASLFGYNAITGGSPDLQPETATTRSIGVVLEPGFLKGFNATIDWWDIKLDQAIAKIGGQAIVDSCLATGNPIFCDRIHRAPNGSLWLDNGFVDNREANIGAFRIKGIDGGANYSFSLGRLGSANFEFRGSYVLKWIVDNGGNSLPYDCAGLFGVPCDIHPKWKHTLRGTWNRSTGFSLSLQWRHMSALKLAALDPRFNLQDQASPANSQLAAANYFDVTTFVRIRKGLALRLGVNNVLDRQPPLALNNTAAGIAAFNGNTYPMWYDPLGRTIFASLSVEIKPR
ncbi:MAG TPA: TonB-dependent receptor [Sphingomicrobium sp.]|nr:TonB-dependent receptor [Sphingomicrobium sp.]